MTSKRKAQDVVAGSYTDARASIDAWEGQAQLRDRRSPGPSSDMDVAMDTVTENEARLEREGRKFVNLLSAFGQHQDPSGHSDAASQFFGKRDFSHLALKPDHRRRPIWIDPEKYTIILENFNPLATEATDFLVTIAEPSSRPTFFHEYNLTAHSLYAAVSVGLQPQDIIGTLDQFCKVELPSSVREFVEACTRSYGKVKLVLKSNKYFVECVDPSLYQSLLGDAVIGKLRVQPPENDENACAPRQDSSRNFDAPNGTNHQCGSFSQEEKTIHAALSDEGGDEMDTVYAFEIPDRVVEAVQQRCLNLSYPMLEEYDFRHDNSNATLPIDLRPNTFIRPYQEKGLSKMFGNGRAKSGIVVLPCGAGKTLVGVTAACTIKKGAVVLCTSSVSAIQWREEFLKWSNITPSSITVFTADNKSRFSGETGIIVTTYAMVTSTRERSEDSKEMMDFLQGREWGLMILDEVHVVPANLFRRVISSIKCHAKLGLTATLLREDDKISHLNFLIGPKLYEANWMELSQQGYIANVQCAEVWCPMPTEFYKQYLQSSSQMKRTLCAINPGKFQACQYLIKYHEARGDKIIVFSDEVYALELYALSLGCHYIHGGTPQENHIHILENFRHNPNFNTLFLSKIGDTSLDLPEATCLIQISSHFGSRRQEAQRLGRILRAKRRSDEGFNAFFYSLVSKDTQEMYFSSKRQAFLVDQGYAFKVITRLQGMNSLPGLMFSTEEEREKLLRRTLAEKAIREDKKKDDSQKKVKMKKKRKLERNAFFKKVARENERLGN